MLWTLRAASPLSCLIEPLMNGTGTARRQPRRSLPRSLPARFMTGRALPALFHSIKSHYSSFSPPGPDQFCTSRCSARRRQRLLFPLPLAKQMGGFSSSNAPAWAQPSCPGAAGFLIPRDLPQVSFTCIFKITGITRHADKLSEN